MLIYNMNIITHLIVFLVFIEKKTAFARGSARFYNGYRGRE